MKNSPLAEIVVEVRWADGITSSDPQFVFGNDSQFIKYGIELGNFGYSNLERVHPEGFPVPAGSVVYRYRNSEQNQSNLFQLGHGVFTCNGLPPYSSWNDFKPIILLGLNALWKSEIISNGVNVEVILRYIDAFTEKHRAGLSIKDFFSSVLGVQYVAPKAFGLESDNDISYDSFRFYISHALNSGSKFSIEAGVGIHDGTPAIILNTFGQSNKFVIKSVDDVLENLEPLQAILHDSFIEMIGRDSSVSKSIVGE